MTKKLNSLTVLFFVTVIMVVLMLFTLQKEEDSGDDFAVLFPELFEQLNDVDTVTFSSPEDNFTMYRKGEDWFIKERWNFPADFNLVKRALIDISEAKILERKTDDEALYMQLGVEGADLGGSSTEITLKAGDEIVAGLILGLEREIPNNTGARQFYVRRAGEARSWLAEGYLNINPVMLNWIKSDVINIARERIAQLNIIQPSGETLTLINLGQKDKFGLPDFLEETTFKYEQLGYDMAGTLFQLKMEDVQPLDEFSREGSEVVTAEFLTFDGLKVTTQTSFIDGFYYTELNAEFNSRLVRPAPADIAQLDVLLSADEVQQEAEKLNKHFEGWVYRFGGFVGTNLMRAKADTVVESQNVIPMPPDLTGLSQ
jgi:hypothetical protein